MSTPDKKSLLDSIIFFCLNNKLVVVLGILVMVAWGVFVAPFDWSIPLLKRKPVPVDAIPDIGENQQIVFTRWMGRSPQDVEDQITYPLTTALLGIPKVKTVRSYSFFGFSTIYIIFNDDADFYWSRSRVLEKLNSLPKGTLPDGVGPVLGPDATALGQVYWYTLEGRDPDGKPTGGWEPQELRSIQDWYVRYALMSAKGVSEAASIGGFVKEYQIDVDPDAMRAHAISIQDVFKAVRMSNVDVGARTIEINRVEYVIRGLGFFRSVKDIEDTVIKSGPDNIPIYVKTIGHVSLGPALRRGALDKAGAEAVGGVVVVRYGFNPLEAIKNVKEEIRRIEPGMPKKAIIDFKKTTPDEIRLFAKNRGFDAFTSGVVNQDGWMKWLTTHKQTAWPNWVTISQVKVIPFYDRTGLIYETLGTLNTALVEEILVTIIVVILMVMHLRSSVLISGLLPLAVLMTFIAMKLFGVDANIVALSGIAIAIGTMVDMGIVICENILKHLDASGPGDNKRDVIFMAVSEVGSAVLTAVATTVVSFLPVFTMTAAEGKLFKPLAFTKTFALTASIIVALMVIPPLAHILFTGRISSRHLKIGMFSMLIAAGIAITFFIPVVGIVLMLLGGYFLGAIWMPESWTRTASRASNYIAAFLIAIVLAKHWNPLGPERPLANILFVSVLIGGLIGLFVLFMRFYPKMLRFTLKHKYAFLPIPVLIAIAGVLVWSKMGREFMPPLDEGSYLLMPTVMPHASIGESMDVLSKQDMAIRSIPEVDSAVGKIGRVDSALDPAPISMIETIITYKSEYITDKNGKRMMFKYDKKSGAFIRDNQGKLIPDPRGKPYRQWRDKIRKPDDIWAEIVKAAEIPGATSAPKLQPIAARIVMLQSGMRAPMGVKVFGPDLPSIEKTAMQIEKFLKEVPSINPDSVVADRVIGKPYLEINIDREAIARYGLHIQTVQDVIETAIGGEQITTTVEGRERYAVRVRYMRELRDNIESLGGILIPTSRGAQIPLRELADIQYVRGPMSIKSENTYLVAYVVFDKQPDYAEVDVVNAAQKYLKEKKEEKKLIIPPGVYYKFSGSYENQLRAKATLTIVLPIALLAIFLILYFQFKSIATTMIVFSGVIIAWSGGFIMLWLYSQGWFMDVSLFGFNLRDLFQVKKYNLSVAVWVGFLALFGIATDNGVIMATYIKQRFREVKPDSVATIRDATVFASNRRIRPALMTTATTLLALIPVLTSTGRGSDVMVPMAIPSFGGMVLALITLFTVPALYAFGEEIKLKFRRSPDTPPDPEPGNEPDAEPKPEPDSDPAPDTASDSTAADADG